MMIVGSSKKAICVGFAVLLGIIFGGLKVLLISYLRLSSGGRFSYTSATSVGLFLATYFLTGVAGVDFLSDLPFRATIFLMSSSKFYLLALLIKI